jgi:hypothetical protein
MSSLSPAWNNVLRVARWFLLAALVVTLLPVLLAFGLGILILAPKGRIWGTFWGNIFANGATGLWHKVFGSPRVRIHRPRLQTGNVRRRRFGHWQN